MILFELLSVVFREPSFQFCSMYFRMLPNWYVVVEIYPARAYGETMMAGTRSPGPAYLPSAPPALS